MLDNGNMIQTEKQSLDLPYLHQECVVFQKVQSIVVHITDDLCGWFIEKMIIHHVEETNWINKFIIIALFNYRSVKLIYVLWSCWITGNSGAFIVRYSQKEEWISFVLYCFESPSIAHNFGTTGPIQVKFSAKCTSLSKWALQSNRKLKMSYVRL